MDYDSATATFAYADDKPPFKGAKPESLERGFRERLNGATRGACGARNRALHPADTEPKEAARL